MESLVSEFVGAEVHQHCDRDGRPKCRFQLTDVIPRRVSTDG
jgi:hypothetical protein